ncbi:hypothetical protein T07_11923 [Trichinella nelsoni]|uniref:Uncharacterized protein n=1 Tax=Trichinella nelsoni TaxID=6336 RepID=A0A0V0RTX1_9BILA|nr:hypothetical protein T07_11923 [Trichinella nelsoni]
MLLTEAAGNYTLLLMTGHHFWHCLASSEIFCEEVPDMVRTPIMPACPKKDRLNTKAASRLAAIIDHWLLFTWLRRRSTDQDMPVTNTTLNYQKLSSHEWQLSCLSPSSKRLLKTKKQTEQLFEVNESDQCYLVTNNQSLLDRHHFEHQLCNIPCSTQPSSLLSQNIKQRFMKNKISSALRLKAQKTARMDETSKNCAANVDSPLHMIEFVYKKGSTTEAVLSVPSDSDAFGLVVKVIRFGMPKLTNSCYASSEKQASSFVGFKWSNTVARGEVVSLTLGITGKELQFLARMSGTH